MYLRSTSFPVGNKQLPNPQSHYPRGKLHLLSVTAFSFIALTKHLATSSVYIDRPCFERRMVIDPVKEIGRLFFCSLSRDESIVKRHVVETFEHPLITCLR